MTVLHVKHRTEYRYQSPVILGQHRLMSRPRDSHDLRLLDTGIVITPSPSELRWMHDVFGNSIAVASFAEPSTFRSRCRPSSSTTMPQICRSATPPPRISTSDRREPGTIRIRITSSMAG